MVAQEAWHNYRARNDSVVVDHFQGLYKSTLVCPQCSFRSIKFDPFMYLSLPLPTTKTCTVEVTVIHMDGAARPMLYAVRVAKNGSIGARGALVGSTMCLFPFICIAWCWYRCPLLLHVCAHDNATVLASFHSPEKTTTKEKGEYMGVLAPPCTAAGDLYQALATMLGIEPPPERSLMLGEVTTSGTMQPLTKMDEPVSHLRRYQTVVAYHYSAQAACGPSDSRHEVHIFNRCVWQCCCVH